MFIILFNEGGTIRPMWCTHPISPSCLLLCIAVLKNACLVWNVIYELCINLKVIMLLMDQWSLRIHCCITVHVGISCAWNAWYQGEIVTNSTGQFVKLSSLVRENHTCSLVCHGLPTISATKNCVDVGGMSGEWSPCCNLVVCELQF